MSLFEIETQPIPSNLLSDRFLVPPFSILDTKQGYWQDRKRNWINLGIKSEVGRGDALLYNIGHWDYDDEKYANTKMAFTSKGANSCLSEEGAAKYGRKAQQTSIFDPVLCEIAYKWFSKENDKIIDPFAGGSVRGLIAGMLKRNYTGIDLSDKQIEANKQQYSEISNKYNGIVQPNWIHGDSLNCKELANDKYNLLFTCPPYYDLEVYSNQVNDLSNMSTYEEFIGTYNNIIKNACDMLENDSFAVIVVGNMRNHTNGGYYDFAGDTVKAFQNAGLIYYNEMILVNVIGTLPVRAPKQFNASRKVGKQHQQVLVFYKGNPNNIKEKFGEFEHEI